MKILKFVVIFAIAFLFASVLIFTFIQPEFKVPASAKIITYTTPKIPIYIYVAGAFGIGLLLGLVAAFYYYFTQHQKVHQATKELHVLEEKLADAKRQLEQYNAQMQTEVEQTDGDIPPSYEEESVIMEDLDEKPDDENDSSDTLPAAPEKDPI